MGSTRKIVGQKIKVLREPNYAVEYAVKHSEYVESYIRSDKTTALRDRVNICCYVGARLASGYFYR